MTSIRLHYRRPPGRKGLELSVEQGGRSERYDVIDLSGRGMRVRGRILPAGERLPLVLRIKDAAIHATGELVWCNERDLLFEDYTMGIRFVVHDACGRERLARYLDTF
ncbi:MAG: PilZ domain-containing protein [Myxococcota bacterium]